MELLVKELRIGILEPDLNYFGHIVVVDEKGKILWECGNPNRVTFSRSSAKPVQAIPILESGAFEKYGITEQELAVMCSSHHGDDFHVEAVRSILEKAGFERR
jgi:L-asparaginase II